MFTKNVGETYLPAIKKRLPASHSRFIDQNSPLVAVDPAYFRPAEVDLLIGDATKARTRLGWIPEYDLHGLIADMLKSDIHLMKKECYLKEGGYRTLNYFE